MPIVKKPLTTYTASWLASLPLAARQKFLSRLSDEQLEVLQHEWAFWCREDQREPEGDWVTWMVKAGRGYGKTRIGAEFILKRARTPKRRLCLVGKTPADVRDTMIEGEALSIETLIPTPNGWAKLGDLQVGDSLFAGDGLRTEIIAVSPVWNDRPCYRMTIDGCSESFIADAKHQWVTRPRNEREPRRLTHPVGIRTTEEISRTLKKRADLYEHEVPMHSAIDLPSQPLPVPPYTLGAWLGDGDTRGHGTLTSHDNDHEVRERIQADGFEVRRRVGCYAWGIRKLRVHLRSAGVIGSKHIPAIYLRAERSQRLALLQGLMDTDGYVSPRGQCAFDNTNALLVRQVRELLLTLGFKPGKIQEKPNAQGHLTIYRVGFQIISETPIPFVLKRKAERCRVGVRPGGRLIREAVPVESVPVRCIQVAHPSGTFLAGTDFVVTHNSGLMAIAYGAERPRYEPTKRRLTWRNGSIATAFSGETPDALRGPQHHAGWFDELAKFRYPKQAWEQFEYGLRLGDDPQVCITTTPRPIPTIRMIMDDPTTIVTHGSTYANAANLAPVFLSKILRKYQGTRLGRQEIEGAMLEDLVGALWTYKLLDLHRVEAPPPLRRIVIAIDPAGSSKEDADETGIIVAGLGDDLEGYVLQDASGHYTPAQWGTKAVQLYKDWKADAVIGEKNNGGEMVGFTVQTAADALKIPVHFKPVTASKGKFTRAEPISALDEQGRVHHVGSLPELEDQMCTWLPGMESPDRMDARVWALTELMLSEQTTGLLDYYASLYQQQQSEKQKEPA